MKIKEEFWELIKQGNKTIELRKVSKLRDLLHGVNSDISLDGKFEIDLHDEKQCDGHNEEKGHSESYCFASDCYCYQNGCKLGSIIINGYQVIKNPFKINPKNYDFIDKRKLTSIYFINNEKGLIDTFFPYDFFKSSESYWITETYEWLYKYFKDQDEILVLNIEKFSGAGYE